MPSPNSNLCSPEFLQPMLIDVIGLCKLRSEPHLRTWVGGVSLCQSASMIFTWSKIPYKSKITENSVENEYLCCSQWIKSILGNCSLQQRMKTNGGETN